MNYRPREMKLRLSCLLLATQKATSWIGPAPIRKRSFKSAYISRMLISFGRSTSHWPESGEAPSACVRAASNRSRRRAWKRCRGHATAASVRSDSTHSSVEEMKIMRAYVLVNAKMGKVRDVAQKIASLAGVKMANACWGVPDVFVVAEVANSAELDQLVIDKIQALEGVERTETHIAID